MGRFVNTHCFIQGGTSIHLLVTSCFPLAYAEGYCHYKTGREGGGGGDRNVKHFIMFCKPLWEPPTPTRCFSMCLCVFVCVCVVGVVMVLGYLARPRYKQRPYTDSLRP